MFRLLGGSVLERDGFCSENAVRYLGTGWVIVPLSAVAWGLWMLTLEVGIPVVCIVSLYCIMGYKMKFIGCIVVELPNNCEVLLDH